MSSLLPTELLRYLTGSHFGRHFESPHEPCAAEGCGKITGFNETWSQGTALELSAKPSPGEGAGKMGFFLVQ